MKRFTSHKRRFDTLVTDGQNEKAGAEVRRSVIYRKLLINRCFNKERARIGRATRGDLCRSHPKERKSAEHEETYGSQKKPDEVLCSQNSGTISRARRKETRAHECMNASLQKSNGRTELWSRVIAAGAGGLILAMQGVNLSETNGQTIYIQKIDTALEQQVSLIKEVNQEGARIDKALENQQHMIEGMDVLLRNQNVALSLLQKNGNREPGNPTDGQ
jgi:hypothetical protein